MPGNSILDEIVYDSEKGALNYKGVRYLLIRPETLAGLQKSMEKASGKQAKKIIFQGGFEGGYLSAKKYKEIHKFSHKEILDFMVAMGSQIGWGSFELNQYDPVERSLKITVEDSPFAEAYGKSSKGVCHLIRGVVSGTASVVFGQDCVASEISCFAKGDRCCVFIAKAE